VIPYRALAKQTAGAPDHIDTKDLLLLYYSIIKDRYFIQNQCSEEELQILKLFFNLLFLPAEGG